MTDQPDTPGASGPSDDQLARLDRELRAQDEPDDALALIPDELLDAMLSGDATLVALARRTIAQEAERH